MLRRMARLCQHGCCRKGSGNPFKEKAKRLLHSVWERCNLRIQHYQFLNWYIMTSKCLKHKARERSLQTLQVGGCFRAVVELRRDSNDNGEEGASYGKGLGAVHFEHGLLRNTMGCKPVV
ncbi:unnamed protein product [Ostreobium quekettii]|uniref:Uncharacterized protein n=1 Tax=Ostreobium quekettii TaxID=121088 RepID=A0A8S1IJW3_9CHLO|nr:unnamed protein product [Ostreobium quekettii]